MFVALAKAQEDLNTLILKERKNKKKTAGVLNLGRRFKEGRIKRERQGRRTLAQRFLIMTQIIMMNNILPLRIDTNGYRIG